MYWVTAEKATQLSCLFPDALFETELYVVKSDSVSRENVLTSCIGGWLSHIGPVTSSALSELLGLTKEEVDQTLLHLEAGGSVLRGQFTNASRGEIEWCDRRLLARIHRLTVGTLRKEIQPVNAAQFMNWLLRWQHVAPGTKYLGQRGTLEALEQLQGFEAPANAWEGRILARRVANYDAKMLDQLCLTGAVGWGRISSRPAIAGSAGGQIRRRVIPSSVAPIAFFVREDADWMIPRNPGRNPGDEDEITGGLSARRSRRIALLAWTWSFIFCRHRARHKDD